MAERWYKKSVKGEDSLRVIRVEGREVISYKTWDKIMEMKINQYF